MKWVFVKKSGYNLDKYFFQKSIKTPKTCICLKFWLLNLLDFIRVPTLNFGWIQKFNNIMKRSHLVDLSKTVYKGNKNTLAAMIRGRGQTSKGAHALNASNDIANGAHALKASIHISKVAHALRAYSSTRPILVNLPWVIKTILFGALLQATWNL